MSASRAKLRSLLVAAILLAAPAGVLAQGGYYYTVKQGDSISEVARRHGLAPAALARANKITAGKNLVAGSRIWVPAKPAAPTPAPAAAARRPSGGTVAPRSASAAAAPRPAASVVTPRSNSSPAPSVVAAPARPREISPPPAAAASAPRTSVYIVAPGDTLWRVARDHGTSVEELAQLNGLKTSAGLIVGQELRVVGEPLRETPGGGFEKPAPVLAAPAASTVSLPATSSASSSSLKPSSRGYIWPVEGRMTKRFITSSDEKYPGIDISVAQGTEVRASAQGKVVYVGDTIPGYGTLVIVEHSGDLATVYGQLGRSLVREGQSVSRGQVLGRSGRSSRGEEVLHFEVRRKGEAVNPEQYLP